MTTTTTTTTCSLHPSGTSGTQLVRCSLSIFAWTQESRGFGGLGLTDTASLLSSAAPIRRLVDRPVPFVQNVRTHLTLSRLAWTHSPLGRRSLAIWSKFRGHLIPSRCVQIVVACVGFPAAMEYWRISCSTGFKNDGTRRCDCRGLSFEQTLVKDSGAHTVTEGVRGGRTGHKIEGFVAARDFRVPV